MISSGVLKCIKNKGLEFFTFTFTTQVLLTVSQLLGVSNLYS